MQSEQNTRSSGLTDSDEKERILEILEEYSGDISEYLLAFGGSPLVRASVFHIGDDRGAGDSC